jgi:hypothetical protein
MFTVKPVVTNPRLNVIRQNERLVVEQLRATKFLFSRELIRPKVHDCELTAPPGI